MNYKQLTRPTWNGSCFQLQTAILEIKQAEDLTGEHGEWTLQAIRRASADNKGTK